MKQHLFFHLKPSSTIDAALEELRELHLSDLYVVEDIYAPSIRIGAWGKKPESCTLQHVIFDSLGEETIDWHAQWTSFSPYFKEGLVHVALPSSDKNNSVSPIFLIPGAGFGDLSHPTTRLVLELIPSYVQNSIVIDMGCGSGILTLASIRLGASFAIGIDRDEKALKHAQDNAFLNALTKQTFFIRELEEPMLNRFLPKPAFKEKCDDFSKDSTSCESPMSFEYVDSQEVESFEKARIFPEMEFRKSCNISPLLIVMNMISSEQIEAWSAHPLLHHRSAVIITSGILLSEQARYLALTKMWNWQCMAEREESGWLCFCFKNA